MYIQIIVSVEVGIVCFEVNLGYKLTCTGKYK